MRQRCLQYWQVLFFLFLTQLLFLSFLLLSLSLLLLFYSLRVFHTSVSRWFFGGDSKSLTVPRTFLSIQADITYAVVLMVSFCPLIYTSFSPFTNPLAIVPSAPITIGYYYYHYWSCLFLCLLVLLCLLELFPFFIIISHQPLKKVLLHWTYTLLIKYLYTYQIRFALICLFITHTFTRS